MKKLPDMSNAFWAPQTKMTLTKWYVRVSTKWERKMMDELTQ